MAMTTKERYEKIMATRSNRQAKLDDLMIMHDTVEAKFNELTEAEIEIPESFLSKRTDLKRKCTVQRVQVKKSDDDLDALFGEFPQFKHELEKELENKKAIDIMNDLAKPVTAEDKLSRSADTAGFTMPKAVKAPEPTLIEQVVQEAAQLVKLNADETMIRQTNEVHVPVVPKTLTEAMMDTSSDYHKWLEDVGYQLMSRGFGIMSIVGHIIQHHGMSHYHNLDFAMLHECDMLHPHNQQKQIKHAFTRVAEIKAQ